MRYNYINRPFRVHSRDSRAVIQLRIQGRTFLGADAEVVDRGGDGLAVEFAFTHEFVQRGDGDALGVDLEVPPQGLAAFESAEATSAAAPLPRATVGPPAVSRRQASMLLAWVNGGGAAVGELTTSAESQ